MSTPTRKQSQNELVNTLHREVESTRQALKLVLARAESALQALDNVQRPGSSLGNTLFGRTASDADGHVARLNLLLDLGNSQGLVAGDIVEAFAHGSDYRYRYDA